MKLPVVVDMAGGPFDGTYEFDAANPFPAGLAFPVAFAVTAYLMSSTAAVGTDLVFDEPAMLRGTLEALGHQKATGGESRYVYRFRTRSVSESGEARIMLEYVESRCADLKVEAVRDVHV